MKKQDLAEDNDPEPHQNGQEKGIFRRLFSFLDFGRPETKKDLDNEIQGLLEEGEEHGLISPLEERMINSILEFRETYASEIMTPAAEMVSFNEEASLTELLDTVIESGFTRIPVYRENPDKVIGIVHAKDLLRLCAGPRDDENGHTEYLRPPYFIPESKPIVDLLREFQKQKIHMAMVNDEFGTMRGLITLEDILEEIVGEIDDEYDEEEQGITVVDGNSIVVHGWLDIEKIEEHFDLELPDGPYESVGGLVIHCLGRLGRPGDKVEAGGCLFNVQSASTRQMKAIKITRVTKDNQR